MGGTPTKKVNRFRLQGDPFDSGQIEIVRCTLGLLKGILSRLVGLSGRAMKRSKGGRGRGPKRGEVGVCSHASSFGLAFTQRGPIGANWGHGLKSFCFTRGKGGHVSPWDRGGKDEGVSSGARRYGGICGCTGGGARVFGRGGSICGQFGATTTPGGPSWLAGGPMGPPAKQGGGKGRHFSSISRGEWGRSVLGILMRIGGPFCLVFGGLPGGVVFLGLPGKGETEHPRGGRGPLLALVSRPNPGALVCGGGWGPGSAGREGFPVLGFAGAL